MNKQELFDLLFDQVLTVMDDQDIDHDAAVVQRHLLALVDEMLESAQ